MEQHLFRSGARSSASGESLPNGSGVLFHGPGMCWVGGYKFTQFANS